MSDDVFFYDGDGFEIVQAEDYRELKAQLEKAEGVIRFYGDKKHWQYGDSTSFTTIFKDAEWLENDRYGGKKAREYFTDKEKV